MFYVFNLKKITKALKYIFLLFLLICLVFAIIFKIYPIKYLDEIYYYSNEYDLEPALVCAIINVESGFNKKAVSKKGASGLMQIMKSTADWAAEEIDIERYSYDNIFNEKLNLNIGCWYISKLKKQFDDNLIYVLAAYNAGSGNVSKWISDEKYYDNFGNLDIPFPETKEYVEKVNKNIKFYRILLDIFGGNYD